MRIVKVPGLIGTSASPGVSAGVWGLLLLALYVVSVTHETTLPAKFLFDEAVIHGRMKTVMSFKVMGDSFDNLAWLFDYFGFSDITISLLGFFTSTLGLIFAVWRAKADSLKPIEFVMVVFWLVNQTVYIGVPSKELIIAILVFLLFVFSQSRAVMPVFLIGAVLITLFFRTYWGIVLASTVFLYFGPVSFRKPMFMAIFSLCLFTVVALVFAKVYGQSLDFARENSNMWRDPSEVGSIIVQFIPGDGIMIGVANVAITLLTFFIPIRLIFSGAAMQMLGGLGILLTFWTAFVRYRMAAITFPVADFEKLCYCLLVSFVITQAIFEPDYGSFLRHLSPISPVIMYLIVRLRVLGEHRQLSVSHALSRV